MTRIIKFIFKLIISLTAPELVYNVLLREVAAHSDTKSTRVVGLIMRIYYLIRNSYNSFIGYQPRDDLILIAAM